MPTDIRLIAQQLVRPDFDDPADLVAWMGAVQAQEMAMAKWAVGLRTKKPALSAVERALKEGKILRLHILRPTWHYVAARDVRWMSQVSGPRIKAAWSSFARAHGLGLEGSLCAKANKLLEKILPGKSLDRAELTDAFAGRGLKLADHLLRYVLCCAEADALICSGPERGRTHTYMLTDERVKNAPVFPREEALFKLARLYFQSHSPASAEDFAWWAGLSVSDARRAIASVGAELARDVFGTRELYVHAAYAGRKPAPGAVHLLPPFDEYLISYKDRMDALDPKHQPKAFNRFGTFYPVLLAEGRIVGNWQKVPRGEKGADADVSFFARKPGVDKAALEKARKRYVDFLER